MSNTDATKNRIAMSVSLMESIQHMTGSAPRKTCTYCSLLGWGVVAASLLACLWAIGQATA